MLIMDASARNVLVFVCVCLKLTQEINGRIITFINNNLTGKMLLKCPVGEISKLLTWAVFHESVIS